jgi:hypothetical protein
MEPGVLGAPVAGVSCRSKIKYAVRRRIVETFLDFFWFMLWFFIWVIWIMLLFRVFGDIFRSESSGWAKVGWVLFVVVLPYLGVFIYLVTQGGKMAEREVASMKAMDEAQRAYIREAAGSGGGTADELEKLASLRDRGVIDATEFEAQKRKLLA